MNNEIKHDGAGVSQSGPMYFGEAERRDRRRGLAGVRKL